MFVAYKKRIPIRFYRAPAINACRCKYACFFDTLYHYALAAKVETQDFASHEEKSIYSSAYNCLLECYDVDGRRKILRLY